MARSTLSSDSLDFLERPSSFAACRSQAFISTRSIRKGSAGGRPRLPVGIREKCNLAIADRNLSSEPYRRACMTGSLFPNRSTRPPSDSNTPGCVSDTLDASTSFQPGLPHIFQGGGRGENPKNPIFSVTITPSPFQIRPSQHISQIELRPLNNTTNPQQPEAAIPSAMCRIVEEGWRRPAGRLRPEVPRLFGCAR
jgi:hypothetical protein